MPPSPTCWPGPRSDLDNLVANWKVQRLTIQPGDDTATRRCPKSREDDEALILRAMMAWDGLSVAPGRPGPMSISPSRPMAGGRRQRLQPSPAEALVTILSTEGDGAADAALIAKVTRH